MRKILTLVLGALLLKTSLCSAVVHFNIDARARSKPQSTNLIGSIGYDLPLWGDSSQGAQNPLFGFVSVGSRFGGSPTLSGYVQVSPIGPVIFEIERSMTQRFGHTVNFPCDSIECKGRLDRTDFSLRLAGAYQEFVFLGSVLKRELKTMDSSTEVLAELEDLVVTPGTHRFTELSGFFGKKLSETQTLGLATMTGQLDDSSRGYQANYAIFRTRCQDYRITVGAGQYKSDYDSLTGFSAILSVSRFWGQTLSLY